MTRRWTALERWPLRRKAYGLLLVSSVVPLLLVTGLVLARERTLVRDANVALLQARVDDVGHTLEALHRGYRGAALHAARDPDVVDYLEDVEGRPRMARVLTGHFKTVQADDPFIRGLGLVGPSGQVIAATEPELVGQNIAFRDYFQRALAGADVYPDLYTSVAATGRAPTIPYATAVRASSGAIIGVYVLWLHARSVWEVMQAANGKAGRGSFFILFDRDGVRIGHSASPDLLFHPASALAPEVERAMLANRRFQERTSELLQAVVPFPLDELRRDQQAVIRRFSPTNHEWNLAVARQFPALGWTLVAMVPERVVEVTTWSVFRQIAPGSLVGLVIAVLGAGLLIRQVVQPIQDLAVAAAALERGDFGAEHDRVALTPITPDEIGHLTRGFRSMARTLAERDQRIQASNRDLRQVLDNVGQGFLSMDQQGLIGQERSAVLEQWFGPVADGEPFWGYLGREDADFAARTERAWRAVVGGAAPTSQALGELPPRLQHTARTFALAYRAVEQGGRVERIILLISDVTVELANALHERKMEAELRQAQKLESVGLLASGIAHEINTPVQFVNDSAHFLKDGIGEIQALLATYRRVLVPVARAAGQEAALVEIAAAAEAADLEYLLENMPRAADRALEGLKRVTLIVRAMKEFAHPDASEMSPADLNQAVGSTLVIARNEYKYVADVETDLAPLPQVMCHLGEVNQAILNIVVNAAHAIAERVRGTEARGRITVRTHHEGDTVLISIGDTGGGIPERIRDRVFDPFFTTKEVGKGTGQGLWMARSVVCEKHGGQLTFETELGRGTTFFVRLPVEGKPRPPAPGTT